MVWIGNLEWDDRNEEHIARHGIERDEVEQVIRGRPFITRSRNMTYRVIGQTDGGRFLTVIVAH